MRASPPLLGPALLDRIGDINRSRLLPIMTRVLDEFDRPGDVIRIDTLDIDLGRFTEDLGGIEERLAIRLRGALSNALLTLPGPSGARGGNAVPAAAALVVAFEYYLLHGVWPYHTGLDRNVAPATCLADIILSDPTALVAMLRRRGQADVVLRRLVKQLPDASLARLLRCLEPMHAAYVLGYIAEVRSSHAVTPIVAATPTVFNEMLWTIVLRDALQSGGLRANRKAFLQRLLGSLARSVGVSLHALMRQLRRGLARQRRTMQPSSLIDILTEIIADERGASTTSILLDLADIFGGERPPGPGELRRLLAIGMAVDPVAVRRPLRRRMRADPGAARRLAASVLAGKDVAAFPADTSTDPVAPARTDDQAAAKDLARLAELLTSDAPPERARFRRVLIAGVARNPAGIAQLIKRLIRADTDRITARLVSVLPDRAAIARLITPNAATADDAAPLARERFLQALRRTGATDIQLAALAQGALARDPAGTRRDMRALIRADSVGAVAVPRFVLLVTTALAPHLALPVIALAKAANCRPNEWPALLAVIGRAGDTSWPAALIADAIVALAAVRGVTPVSLRHEVDRVLVKSLLDPATMALARVLARDLRAVVPTDLPDRLRAASGNALTLIAALPPAAFGTALPAVLAKPTMFAAALAPLAPDESALAAALARLLTSRRSSLPPAKLARAFALTAGARDWRGGEGFAAHWLKTLTGLATLAEQASLSRLLDRNWPDNATHAVARSKLALPLTATASAGAGGWDLAVASPQRVRADLGAVRKALRNSHGRVRAAAELTDGELRRLLALLAPRTAAALLRAAGLIAAARTAAGVPLSRSELWRVLLAAAVDHPGDVAPLVAMLLDGADGVVPALDLARHGAVTRALYRSLDGDRDAPLRAAVAIPKIVAPPRQPQKPIEPPPPLECIFIANAGLVLTAAFLPRLFSNLHYLALDAAGRQSWAGPLQRERAVHLLQWLVSTRCARSEPLLALNKILCGMHPSEPIGAAVELDDTERRAGESLLNAILGRWPPLATSSMDALRDTFLQREGRLETTADGWSLDVERKTVDILLDQLPWRFSMILQPWMPGTLAVRW